MKENETDKLLYQNNEHLKKLHEIVKKTLEEEELIIDNLLHPPKEILSQGQRISDKVARFGGSWNFIISFGAVLVVWILFNAFVPAKDRFDPFPFILMNLVLSCIAALQAPIIMMSQNRQEEKDRMRSENDYLVNLKAELEIRSLHQKLDLLLEDQIKELYESQAKQLSLLENLRSRVETLCERAK
ncbi:MAG TPA: DUF1003 domain-containing protein [Flavipsychrobacter sp.]|nr:DUF1003 domain-containing protein [Flavipsychrobacter sp.]